MKKFALIISISILLISTAAVFAGSVSETISWNTTGGQGPTSGYFTLTGSGVVQMWSDHAKHGPSHWVMKPLSKFKNASVDDCDTPNLLAIIWSPYKIRLNALTQADIDAYDLIFPEGRPQYLLCIYSTD